MRAGHPPQSQLDTLRGGPKRPFTRPPGQGPPTVLLVAPTSPKQPGALSPRGVHVGLQHRLVSLQLLQLLQADPYSLVVPAQLF